MEYNNHKSVTIPNQVLPLRELLHRFTNGVPISDDLQRQGSYDFSKPFTKEKLPTPDLFDIGHDANEIDITIAEAKARNGKSYFSNNKPKPQSDEENKDKKDDES